MNSKLKSIIVLSAICAGAALLLGIVNYVTSPVIAANLAEKERQNLSLILKDGEVGKKTVVEDYPGVGAEYSVLNVKGDVIGVVLTLKGEGYGGTIFILSYYDPEGNLIDARITKHSESPGIGSEAAEPSYMKKFTGKGGVIPLPRFKGDLSTSEADAVSGASVTFEAVSKILDKGSSYVKEKGIQ